MSIAIQNDLFVLIFIVSLIAFMIAWEQRNMGGFVGSGLFMLIGLILSAYASFLQRHWNGVAGALGLLVVLSITVVHARLQIERADAERAARKKESDDFAQRSKETAAPFVEMMRKT